jgi:hypothetical protein
MTMLRAMLGSVIITNSYRGLCPKLFECHVT